MRTLPPGPGEIARHPGETNCPNLWPVEAYWPHARAGTAHGLFSQPSDWGQAWDWARGASLNVANNVTWPYGRYGRHHLSDNNERSSVWHNNEPDWLTNIGTELTCVSLLRPLGDGGPYGTVQRVWEQTSSSIALRYWVGANKFNFRLNNQFVDTTPAVTVAFGEWYHLVGRWRAPYADVWANGKQGQTRNDRDAPLNISGDPITHGNTAPNLTAAFNGPLVYNLFYTRFLSDSEVLQLYEDPFCWARKRRIVRPILIGTGPDPNIPIAADMTAEGSATMNANGAVAVAADMEAEGQAQMSVDGAVSVSTAMIAQGAATMQASSDASIAADMVAQGMAQMSVDGAVGIMTEMTAEGAATMSVVSTSVPVAAEMTAEGAASMQATGATSIAADMTAEGAATLILAPTLPIAVDMFAEGAATLAPSFPTYDGPESWNNVSGYYNVCSVNLSGKPIKITVEGPNTPGDQVIVDQVVLRRV